MRNKKWWDVKRLEYESDMETVANSLGMQRDRSGSYKCPNPSHNDAHFGNCYLTRDRTGIVCYVCKNDKGRNKVWGPLSLLMECYGFKFADACEYLANLTGCPDRYEKNAPKQTSKKSSAQQTYCLTAEEQEILGIDNGRTVSVPVESFGNQRPSKNTIPLGWHTKEFSIYNKMEDEAEPEYVLMRPTQVNFMDYAIVGSDFFKEIVRGKCIEQLAKYYMFIAEINMPLSYPAYAKIHIIAKETEIDEAELKKEFESRIEKIWKIYLKYGGNPIETSDGIIKKYNAITRAYTKEGH